MSQCACNAYGAIERSSNKKPGREGEYTGGRERIKYVLTAFWPEGWNTEIVASGCHAGVAPFTREQTLPDPGWGNITHHYRPTDNVVSDG